MANKWNAVAAARIGVADDCRRRLEANIVVQTNVKNRNHIRSKAFETNGEDRNSFLEPLDAFVWVWKTGMATLRKFNIAIFRTYNATHGNIMWAENDGSQYANQS